MKINHFTDVSRKIPWKSIDSSQHSWAPAPCFTWIAVSCFLRLRSFTQGVSAAIYQGKNQVPDLQSIESCSKPLTGFVFPKKQCGGWFRHGWFFFEVLDFRNLLEAFLSARTNGIQLATSSWSFDPATSWGQLALEYIYILLDIGSTAEPNNTRHSNSISPVPQHWQPDAWTGLRAFVRPNFTWTFVWSMAMYLF